MDPRRLLSLAACGLLLSGCALIRPFSGGGEAPLPDVPRLAPVAVTLSVARVLPSSPTERAYLDVVAGADAGVDVVAEGDAVEDEAVTADAIAARDAPPTDQPPEPAPRPQPVVGPTAIAAANAEARAASSSDSFVGGVQVFSYDPGRVYEIWTAPLRVTTLTLAPGETVTSKAAGDTVRWQIGEASSGSGPNQRAHVLLKPLERGLETNLVLTTSQRVYFLQLKSGSPDGFNAAVAWDIGAVIPPGGAGAFAGVEERVADPVAVPTGPLDARYRIDPRGRAPRWTPTSVFNDGTRTFITFSPDLQVDEAPALFVIAPDGEAQMVNYRQQGGLFVVDRVFDRAELRLGDRRPQIVRLQRLGSADRIGRTDRVAGGRS
ncbi:MAG: P-type conjugative transfer protein TrbG [Brevundimonas sp.]|uniref:P-type conjugative transfer protein TrbG n=1 Tax=Brevundimonas sp. TaxID=1871086 RepID=UPI0027333D58|nr:P-type conjugative transfer protein TrbG [Brevundimonas sp.]MDP3405780.1 P-type conjugative transfer protein TrbG [Brevundimonas sp.]